MILTFIAPGAPHPIGGVTMIYEYASAMARRGHEVHLFHYPVLAHPVSSLEEVSWFDFDDRITHFFPPVGFDPATAPPSDFIFGFSREDGMPPHLGLPVAIIQGYRMVRERHERRTFHAPCPKICVARWLVDVGVELGVPAQQLVHVPLGLRHERFRVVHPLDDRPRRVTFCFHRHPQKGADRALEVVQRLRAEVPDVEVVAFGAEPPLRPLPAWIDYRTNPEQDELVGDIYNKSRIFICTSIVEGFGLTNVEAMACGAALVTTDNGGSRDYAVHGRTALVSPVDDLDTMVDHVASLLQDDDLRRAIAAEGVRYVQRFDWDRTAELLEAFLETYRADPVAFGRPRAAVTD